MGKRQYSDSDKAAVLVALDANAGNVAKTSKQLGIPRQTIQEWSHNRNVNNEVPNLRQIKKEELSVRFEHAVHEMVDVLPSKRGKASLKDVATAIGILTDKMQLLKGKPTSINESLTPEQKRERVKEVLKEEGILSSDRVQ